MATQELCFLSAAELAAQIRARTISPVEIVEAYLERIATFNEALRAYLYIASDQARDAARAAEIEISAGGIADLCTASQSPIRTSTMLPACRLPLPRK